MPRLPQIPPSALRAAGSAAAALFLIVAAGCETRQPDSFAQAVAMGERPVAMRGTTAYFNGDLAVTVTVSRGVGAGLHGDKAAGKHHGGGGYGGPAPDVSGMDQDTQVAYMRARGALGSPLPPVTIRLKLENKGKRIFNVDVAEMNSDLGNFAVDPEVLSLAPGQTAEPYPMISQLGITSDLIPFKVTLRVGGKTESQTIRVRNLKDAADAQ